MLQLQSNLITELVGVINDKFIVDAVLAIGNDPEIFPDNEKGCTVFPDDGSIPWIVINADIPLSRVPEIVLHKAQLAAAHARNSAGPADHFDTEIPEAEDNA